MEDVGTAVDGAAAANGDGAEVALEYSAQQVRVLITRAAALLEGLDEDEYLSTTDSRDIATLVYVATNLGGVVRVVGFVYVVSLQRNPIPFVLIYLHQHATGPQDAALQH